MARPTMEFHFGIDLKGDHNQLKYWDASAAAYTEFKIPAGRYYFDLAGSTMNLYNVISDFLKVVFPACSITLASGDRQIEWNLDNAADWIRLIDTGDEDNTKIARMMGLYDNTGDLIYFESNNITDGYISNNTLSSWFAAGGLKWQNYDLEGFEEYNAEIMQTSGGNASQVGGEPVARLPLEFTVIDGDTIRGGLPTATQAVPGTTINSTWTTSLQQASHAHYQTPEFYAELDSTTMLLALRSPITMASVRQIKPGWSQHHNLSLDLNRLPI